MHVHRLQPIAQISTMSIFRRLCDFTRKCRTWRKTLLNRRLINREQAQRRTLAYDRLTRPVFRKTLGTSLVTVGPTVITLNRFKVCIISWSNDWWPGMRSIFHQSTDDVLWPCCLGQQPPYAASVSTSSTQLRLRWCSAHLSTVLELGTYAVHCEQQSQDLCVLVYMKQQLMSWDLQHIASSFWNELSSFCCWQICIDEA